MKFNKKEIIKLIFPVFILILFTVVMTYLIFENVEPIKKEEKVDNSVISYKTNEISNIIELKDLELKTDEDGKVMNDTFKFSMQGKTVSSNSISYKVILNSENVNVPLDTIKVYLTDVNGNSEIPISNVMDEGIIKVFSEFENYETNKNDIVLYEGMIPANTLKYQKDFKLRIWLNNSLTLPEGEKATFDLDVISDEVSLISDK